MKKVLILSLGYFPKHVGGAEVSIKEITDRIDDIEFHMIANRYDATLPPEEKIGNVTVHRIGITRPNPSMADLKKWPLNFNKPLYQFLAAWKALRLHRTHHFDGMWAMMAHATGVSAALIKIFHPEIRYVLNLQEGDPIPYIEKKMRPLWPLFTRAFTSADIVQCLSHYLAKWARARGFRGHVEVVPNAADVKHFSAAVSPARLSQVRAELGKNMGDVFLITTSRLVPKNAIDDVIRALPQTPASVHFIVLGTGPDESALRTLAQSLGVSERVRFVGHVSHADMPAYLQASDIFIRPSRSEGFGASFVEAMAAGLPVIATQEGGIADFLYDATRNPDMPVTGWAVDANAPVQIAQAVRDIMTHPERVQAVVATAREMVKERYDWDVIARLMRTEVFGRLFGEKPLAQTEAER